MKYLLSDRSEIPGDRDPLPARVVDPQYQDARHGGGRGEDHDGGVVHADDRGLVGGREALHHRHQEHRHVQHRLDREVSVKVNGGNRSILPRCPV